MHAGASIIWACAGRSDRHPPARCGQPDPAGRRRRPVLNRPGQAVGCRWPPSITIRPLQPAPRWVGATAGRWPASWSSCRSSATGTSVCRCWRALASVRPRPHQPGAGPPAHPPATYSARSMLCRRCLTSAQSPWPAPAGEHHQPAAPRRRPVRPARSAPARPARTGRRKGQRLPSLTALADTSTSWQPATVRRSGKLTSVQLAARCCLLYSVHRARPVRVVLVRESGRRNGFDLALVSTDHTASPAELVCRYAARWAIEVSFLEAKQLVGVGQARNRHRRAIVRTMPFGYSLLIVWYTRNGHATADAAARRAAALVPGTNAPHPRWICRPHSAAPCSPNISTLRLVSPPIRTHRRAPDLGSHRRMSAEIAKLKAHSSLGARLRSFGAAGAQQLRYTSPHEPHTLARLLWCNGLLRKVLWWVLCGGDPSMACKGSGVQIPSAPPGTTHRQHSRSGSSVSKLSADHWV